MRQEIDGGEPRGVDGIGRRVGGEDAAAGALPAPAHDKTQPTLFGRHLDAIERPQYMTALAEVVRTDPGERHELALVEAAHVDDAPAASPHGHDVAGRRQNLHRVRSARVQKLRASFFETTIP